MSTITLNAHARAETQSGDAIAGTFPNNFGNRPASGRNRQ